jgi:branched-chain amino acid transport system substrate-binding protein
MVEKEDKMKKMVYKFQIIMSVIVFSLNFYTISKAAETIKIGMPIPLSGPMGNVGLSVQQGAKYAIAEIEKKKGFLGRHVELLVRDDTGKADMTMRVARELVTKDNVNFLVGTVGSATALALSQVGKERKVLTIVHAKTDKLTVEGFHRYGFAMYNSTHSEGGQAALIAENRLIKNIKNPRIYYLSYDYEYGHAIWDSFVPRLKELRPDAKFVGEAWVRIGETDFTATITAILAAKPDLVLNSIWAGGIIGFFKQAKPYGLFEKTKFLCTAEGVAIDYTRALGKDMPEGIWGNAFDVFYWPDNPAHNSFIQGINKMFNIEDPGNYALPTYLAIHLLNAAVQKAGKVETEAVINALEEVRIDSPFGEIYFRKCDHQSNYGEVWGVTKKSPKYPFLILDELEYVPTSAGWYTCEEVESLRAKAKK